jgi:hemerythrin
MEPLFVWKPSFELGLPGIDREHRRFFDILNALHDAMARPAGEVVLRQRYLELVGYARHHFAHEEALLADVAYPALGTQRREHAHFVEQLGKLAATPSPSARAALALAKDWMLQHILGTDRGYVAWVAARKAQRDREADELVVEPQALGAWYRRPH